GLVTSVDLNERYLAGDPLQPGPTSLWGIPVTLTTKILSGRVLAGNFAIGTRGWVKGGIRLLSNTDGDDFSRNNVTFVCEERLLTAAVAPSALVQIDLVSDFGSS
ncbi:MAG: phage major capsid family protein, partial [Acidimicrobiia bacterium]